VAFLVDISLDGRQVLERTAAVYDVWRRAAAVAWRATGHPPINLPLCHLDILSLSARHAAPLLLPFPPSPAIAFCTSMTWRTRDCTRTPAAGKQDGQNGVKFPLYLFSYRFYAYALRAARGCLYRRAWRGAAEQTA